MPVFDDEVPRKIAGHVMASAGRRAERERVGPFLAAFDAHSASPFRNYAVPDDGASPSPADVEALVAVFERRGRHPRLEYVAAAAPSVAAVLLAAGFVVEQRTDTGSSWSGWRPSRRRSASISVPGSLRPGESSGFLDLDVFSSRPARHANVCSI